MLPGPRAPRHPTPADPIGARHAFARWPFWLMLALFLLVVTAGVGEMWLYGHHGWNGARRGIAGINYNKYGFVETRFGPVENYGFVEKEKFRYYWHHPVLVNVLVGVAFKLFGVHEWAARLVPITASLISFVLLYLLALRWWRMEGAIATTAYHRCCLAWRNVEARLRPGTDRACRQVKQQPHGVFRRG